ncbi:MAG: 6,7-dimethyl-8-ribityllumazine synthase [Bacteroidota bacterium]|nr:6,7-dimethyl-8-ribityllumazine synthase [Bacteroidota bacterium]MDP4225487.1 6,7-dimethyl-8-ribityllumazine synthase [Bacteroidota bacterium]MDP4274204.1 6,7-dimethyl-8-ribityllumazine synthase [Bacteroidota bacterium]
MSTDNKNLSEYDADTVPSAADMKFGIVVSEYNNDITEAVFNGTYKTLLKHGAKEENLLKRYVPGGFELTLGAQFMAEYTNVDAIICIGCIIRGETAHFDYICDSITKGLTDLNLEYNLPFLFGVLTTNNYEQALERSGGKRGNKGDEVAIAAIKMVALKREMEKRGVRTKI